MAREKSMTTAADTAETEAAERVAKTVLVLMGVSGSGKTTVALELRRLLEWPFKEGDDLHPAAP
jgi:adenylylsulfate kinase-like enzyme